MINSQRGQGDRHNGQAGCNPDGIGLVLAERYRLDELVGRGGMASVYRAKDLALGRTVAIKMFRADLADADDVRRQRDEITLLASLNHPGLVTLFDAVADDRQPGVDRVFLVMEFVDGSDLRFPLAAGALDPRLTALIGADVADALSYVHDRGVIHRDIKPGNILLPLGAAGGLAPQTAKLADFGIARLIDGSRLTATGSVLGTASYLSPEQAAGSALGPASDIYSLGLVLLECLTGTRAFPGSGLESAVARLARDPEIPVTLGRAWVRCLGSMTARRPQERPAASDVAGMLRGIAREPAAGADTGSEPTRAYPAVSAVATGILGTPATSDLAATKILQAGTDVADVDVTRMGAADTGSADGEFAASSIPLSPATAELLRATAAPSEATTRLLHPTAPAAVDVGLTPGGAGNRGRAGRRLPRWLPGWLLATVTALIVVGVASAVWIGTSRTETSGGTSTTSVHYPAVGGDLGSHLKQLERSVAP
jgi:tRNA A-37 threonylcarbamoyl transferase component Bud32